MIFGVTLNRHGWRIDYLGADTPVEELSRTAAARPSDLVVLAATRSGTLEPLTAELAALARTAALALAGAGAAPQLAAAVGAQCRASDPVTAAETIGRPR
jgi:methanogenic corrinoid protein MtbC1